MRRRTAFGRRGCAKLALRMSAFQGTFINFPIYVAKDLGLFGKHGIAVEIVYGKGIQPTNMVVRGATEFGVHLGKLPSGSCRDPPIDSIAPRSEAAT